MNLSFPFAARYWQVVDRDDQRARRLADRHYSRRTPGAAEFLYAGRTLVLLGTDELAVWGAIHHLQPKGDAMVWRCAIFRDERPDAERNGGGQRPSDLVRDATTLTKAWWRYHYGALPAEPLTTEIDPAKVRAKRDPGRCFLRAGWTHVRTSERRGHVILQAPALPAVTCPACALSYEPVALPDRCPHCLCWSDDEDLDEAAGRSAL